MSSASLIGASDEGENSLILLKTRDGSFEHAYRSNSLIDATGCQNRVVQRMRLHTIDNVLVSLNNSYDLAGEFIPNENMSAKQKDEHREACCDEQEGFYPQSEPDMTWLSDQKLASLIIVRVLRWPS